MTSRKIFIRKRNTCQYYQTEQTIPPPPHTQEILKMRCKEISDHLDLKPEIGKNKNQKRKTVKIKNKGNIIKQKNSSGSSSDDDLREDNREDQARYKPSEQIINKLTNHSYNNFKKLVIIKQGIKLGYIPNAKMETLNQEDDIIKYEKINLIPSTEVHFRNKDTMKGRPA